MFMKIDRKRLIIIPSNDYFSHRGNLDFFGGHVSSSILVIPRTTNEPIDFIFFY